MQLCLNNNIFANSVLNILFSRRKFFNKKLKLLKMDFKGQGLLNKTF